MSRKLSVAELRDLFEHGAKPEDLLRIRQIEEIFLNESKPSPSESKTNVPSPNVVRAEEEEDDEELLHQPTKGYNDDQDMESEAITGLLQLQNFRLSNERELYQVIFDADSNGALGMVVQQQDEEIPGSDRIREKLVVEMVTQSGAAFHQGITEGSTLIKVNGIDVSERSYVEALGLLKQPTRPLVLEFERGLGIYTTQGYCFKAATKSFQPPKRFSAWKLRYYVLGGPVAGSNVLQIYKSKSDFDKIVLSVVSRKPVHQSFKAYLLTNEYHLSVLKQKHYDSRPAPLDFFSIRRPGTRFNKVMHIARIPNDSSNYIRNLYHQLSEMAIVLP